MVREGTSGEKRVVSNRRRRVLQACAIGGTGLVAGCLQGSNGGDGEEEYPSESFEFIIPYSQGGGMDTWARGLFPIVADELGQDVEFRNVGGSGGIRGLGELAVSDSNGHVLSNFSLPLVPLAWLRQEPDWELTDLSAVCMFTENIRLMMFANPDLGAESVEDVFEAYRNGDINTFGSADQDALESTIARQLRDDSEYDVPWENLVEYEGSGPLIQAVAAGEVPVGIATDSAASGAGYLDEIDFVTSLAGEPSAVLEDPINPDEPTLEAAGYEPFDILATYRSGFYFPPDAPMERRETLAEATQTALESDELAEWEEETGNVGGPYRGPEETQDLLAESIQTIEDTVDLG